MCVCGIDLKALKSIPHIKKHVRNRPKSLQIDSAHTKMRINRIDLSFFVCGIDLKALKLIPHSVRNRPEDFLVDSAQCAELT